MLVLNIASSCIVTYFYLFLIQVLSLRVVLLEVSCAVGVLAKQGVVGDGTERVKNKMKTVFG